MSTFWKYLKIAQNILCVSAIFSGIIYAGIYINNITHEKKEIVQNNQNLIIPENKTLIDIQTLKHPFLTTYWGLWSQNIKLEEIPSWFNVILVSFAEIGSGGAINFDNNNYNLMKSIESAHLKNQIVLLSVGGGANCVGGLFNDQTFGRQDFNENIFIDSVLSTVNIYNFDGVDIDYECYSTFNNTRKQNDINVVSATKNLRNRLQNKLLTWAAFSSVWTTNSFADYRTAYLKILEYIDYVFWMTYNVSKDDIVANEWYSLVESRISELNFNTSKICYGYCIGDGCSYGIGPSDSQVLKWAQSRGQCLFLWDIDSEVKLAGSIGNLENSLSHAAAVS